MLNTQLYVCQLSHLAQDYIYNYVDEYLFDEGYDENTRKEALENVMCERLCNIDHVLDMDELEGIINGRV